MNVHTRERQTNESQEQYRQRMRVSRGLVRTMRNGPTQEPVRLDTSTDGTPKMMNHGSSFWLGQHTNARKNEGRALKAQMSARQFRLAVKAARAAHKDKAK